MADRTPRWLLDLLDERDGHVCAWTGRDTGRLVPQHRQGGMGGSANKHRASNVVWLDSIINGQIESVPWMQAEALARGIKVASWDDTETREVQHAVHGRVRLLDDGSVRPAEVTE